MSDDKNKRGEEDRRTVAEGEEYEVRYFAQRHGITTQQARMLIHEHGQRREVLDEAADKLKAG